MYKGQGGITIIEGLEPVRMRPAMYIGAEEPGRSPSVRLLLEGLVDAVAHDTPSPQEIRVRLWSSSAITVAYDGAPLPIEPFAPQGGFALHPAIYQLFMYVSGGAAPFGRFHFGAILNALSERLVVSTMHDGHRYRVVFIKGMLMTLLHHRSCRQPFGTNWFTFRPDTTIIDGRPVTSIDMQRIAERQGSPRICVEERSNEEADWS
jgi:DNA gyrase subunit B